MMKMNKKRRKGRCDCLTRNEIPYGFDFCSLHQAAEDLLEAVKWAVVRLEKDEFEATEWMLNIIIRAEGEHENQSDL